MDANNPIDEQGYMIEPKNEENDIITKEVEMIQKKINFIVKANILSAHEIIIKFNGKLKSNYNSIFAQKFFALSPQILIEYLLNQSVSIRQQASKVYTPENSFSTYSWHNTSTINTINRYIPTLIESFENYFDRLFEFPKVLENYIPHEERNTYHSSEKYLLVYYISILQYFYQKDSQSATIEAANKVIEKIQFFDLKFDRIFADYHIIQLVSLLSKFPISVLEKCADKLFLVLAPRYLEAGNQQFGAEIKYFIEILNNVNLNSPHLMNILKNDDFYTVIEKLALSSNFLNNEFLILLKKLKTINSDDGFAVIQGIINKIIRKIIQEKQEKCFDSLKKILDEMKTNTRLLESETLVEIINIILQFYSNNADLSNIINNITHNYNHFHDLEGIQIDLSFYSRYQYKNNFVSFLKWIILHSSKSESDIEEIIHEITKFEFLESYTFAFEFYLERRDLDRIIHLLLNTVPTSMVYSLNIKIFNKMIEFYQKSDEESLRFLKSFTIELLKIPKTIQNEDYFVKNSEMMKKLFSDDEMNELLVQLEELFWESSCFAYIKRIRFLLQPGLPISPRKALEETFKKNTKITLKEVEEFLSKDFASQKTYYQKIFQ
ncbi:hypothetical protein TRFO_15443 [Tritrichomonas foetus]|uniref:Uncharacterized protein n=1 Tax=Tritrichomonas foetus TaxID=1144522 RepID=A0A1J4KX38_9EUKA|nr:hypothetical protein TRFO_15443 [Tritrichomonas foetus]|eukprot:OHT14270.1 hypothetical protein TRFO_15443 [Tritrichomonas foetus]